MDFNKPQRQSPAGIVVLFIYSVQQNFRVFWPVLLIYIFRFKELNKLYLIFGLLLILIIIALIAYLKYRNFTFFLDAEKEEFILSDGIFNKTKTAIQLDKIQQVSINQSFAQKIIGVYELQVDTAGSSKTEVNIKAISHIKALELKSRLLDYAVVMTKVDEDVLKPLSETADTKTLKPIINLSLLSLFKLGISSNYRKTISLIFIFLFTIYENFGKFGQTTTEYQDKVDSFINQSAIAKSNLIVIVLVLFVVLILNVARVVIQYYGYTISIQKESLVLSYGLFNSRSTILKPEKVQITTVQRNFIQKKLGIVQIKIRQSAGLPHEHKSLIEIPGCSLQESQSILKLLFHLIPTKDFALKPNYRKLIVSLVIFIAVPIALFFASSNLFAPYLLKHVYFVPIYIILVGIIQYCAFKNNKLFINENFIIKQSGCWDISSEIIEPHKIQAISTSQYFWHKKSNLGSIILHTAGGDIAFQMGDFSVLNNKVNLWLYGIEKSDINWM